LRGGGRVLVIDAIPPAVPGPHDSKTMDFMMLGALTGEETRGRAGRAAYVPGTADLDFPNRKSADPIRIHPGLRD